jgi:23S rRNA (cytosine1962-C5)-methyltransferase
LAACEWFPQYSMFSADQYQLLDFGDARRLERVGPFTLDRPCPGTEHVARANPQVWQQADARFDRTGEEQGRWTFRGELPERWTIAHGGLLMEVKPTVFGQVGVFFEQAVNWDWLLRCDCRRVLNLFAYTGASTLAAAMADAAVVHVDAARNMAAWARRNAELSALAAAPIHWIVDDALKFTARELRRGSRYDGIILDPPSYGHGPHGEVWRLAKHLDQLLARCAELMSPSPRFLLLTCHTPGFTPARLRKMVCDILGEPAGAQVAAEPLVLRDSAGRELPCGTVVRWQADARG